MTTTTHIAPLPGSWRATPDHRARVAYWRGLDCASYRYFTTAAEAYRARFAFVRHGFRVTVQTKGERGGWY